MQSKIALQTSPHPAQLLQDAEKQMEHKICSPKIKGLQWKQASHAVKRNIIVVASTLYGKLIKGHWITHVRYK